MSSGQKEDVMTISIMNLIVVSWLDKTDPKLIEIVKHEYATELRGGSQLIQLMPRIASSMDSLLARNDPSLINRMRSEAIKENEIGREEDDDTQINKRKRKEKGMGRSFGGSST